jgi:fermentation-respiration switch protein FrsA (DUF1100 family)
VDDADDIQLELESVGYGELRDGVQQVWLFTDDGTIDCRYHPAGSGDAAVIWVGGAGGGLDGPAGGLYARLAARLAPAGVASLRLDYRRPNQLAACTLDTLLAITHLAEHGRQRFILAGHSFGGAVVISAGALSPQVIGVAALSSQTYGTAAVADLSPRPLLLLHGGADEVLPPACSHDLYRRARAPRQLRLYPGCGHGLDACRDQVDRDLLDWIAAVVQSSRP